jgi:hypothetical protein
MINNLGMYRICATANSHATIRHRMGKNETRHRRPDLRDFGLAPHCPLAATTTVN